MKKSIIAILVAALIIGVIALGSLAADLPFASLFLKGFGGYTSDEGQIITNQFVSSQAVQVTAGETVWFGPCEPHQYFQLVGQDAQGKTVTDKIRGKHLTVVDEFLSGMVIYSYTVPEGVSQLVFSVPTKVADVFAVSDKAFDELKWRAYWALQDVNVEDLVGKSSYYEVDAGDKLYFGAVKLENALDSIIYNSNAEITGTMAETDLRLVETFGGDYGIYCYTVPAQGNVSYVKVMYDATREQYYQCMQVPAADAIQDNDVVEKFITLYGVPRPMQETVEALKGKTALFLGDSITFGARDRANIYGVVGSVNEGAGGWAARIGYYTGMNVTNNGVSGACITTGRVDSHSEKHYIYNNLTATAGTTFDYVIMHGMFNDVSENVPIGTIQGKENFDPAKADVTTFAGGLELLFYTARQQNPDAILGYIVNFHTDRAAEEAKQGQYVTAAIAICENWGVEYLDLYNRTGFSVEFDDGLHPSSKGYDSMYCIIANWMATLDGTLDAHEKTAYQPAYDSDALVMSYNVYFDMADRAQKIAELIKTAAPDVLLLQEAHADWVNALGANGLTGYSAFGHCHKDDVKALGSCGHEMTPVLWKTDKYTLLHSGYVHVPSDVYPRTVNYVVLEDKTTGGQLIVMNYHAVPDKDGFDGEYVRRQTAQLLAWELEKLSAAYPEASVVMGGDCNMSNTSTAYFAFVGNGVNDTRKVAVQTTAEGTYNAWDRTDPAKYAMGDYIFTGENVQVEAFDVLCDEDFDSTNNKHFSDHSPLVAKIKY